VIDLTLLILVPLALLLDWFLGEPSRFHPLVGFGKIANRIESRLNTVVGDNALFRRGVVAWMIAVMPMALIVYLIDEQIEGVWVGVLCGWLAIGWHSLVDHGRAVAQALANKELDNARLKTSYLVSRDTTELDESALSRATIESLLENGSDAIIAPLFWLMIFGAPGVVMYRLSNTLDAMWGYRNERFEHFGKFTAWVDDVLNYIPARMTAFLYMFSGNTQQAWRAWVTQGCRWYSPNAGIVMASGAGALTLKLGGNAVYFGVEKKRPALGSENHPEPEDIYRALRLINRSVYGLTGFVLLCFFINWIMG